jgi:hypothetical protein
MPRLVTADRSPWGSLRTLWATVAALALVGCIPSPTPKLVPSEPREPALVEWPAVALNAQQADGVLVGQVAEMQEDWTYDDPCRLLTILTHGCDGTVTYRVKLSNWQTDHYVWAFTPAYGVFGLHVGEKATYLWHHIVAYQFQKCSEQQAMSSAACPYDVLDAFQSDYDVLPVADSAVVDSIRARRPQ